MRNKNTEIAVVGMACKYPDIRDYHELWENVLMQRRSFRKFPESRLASEYFANDHPDKIYTAIAAVIAGYQFDRLKYGISGKNFRTADLTHWLALDVATLALEDAGLMGDHIIPKDKTGVFVGNTLTGEFSRANVMRLRWPFVKKKVMGQLLRKNWSELEITNFLDELEEDYKSSFQPMYEDSLAGGLANTIAGRICNFHDFHGGGYTVDGACSSSLLAVIEACKSLESGDQLISLAGGVDLSLDPFELVGFSRAGALAKKEMLVYDQNSNGFWPGEGCGFVVLANLDFAVQNNLTIHAVIKGYGISSDGQGGLTRPAVSGQRLAMDRAYEQAGYSINDVAYFEGHGTGTEVGDQVELQTIISGLNQQRLDDRKHYIGTIKGNIGHTKAAAGIAGLLKAVNVLKNRTIPPITGCVNQHQLFTDSPLSVPFTSIPFESAAPMKASVSAMGFGGINTHITLQEYYVNQKTASDTTNAHPLKTNWSSLMFLFSGNTREELMDQVKHLSAFAGSVSESELADLSSALFKSLNKGKYRAAIVASSPNELSLKLNKLSAAIADQRDFVQHNQVFFYGGTPKSNIGYLFPGQGSKSFSTAGRLKQQFPWVEIPHYFSDLPSVSTHLKVTQPAIVGTSMISVSILRQLGIIGQIGVGHSLGEIAALGWSGVLKAEDAALLAAKRGEIMHGASGIDGLMLIVSASKESLTNLIENRGVEIAAINSPQQTVVSGKASEINQFKAELSSLGIASTLLPVKYAFHSTAMAVVESDFAAVVDQFNLRMPKMKMISSVSGVVESDLNHIRKNLVRQLSSPVQFLEAVKAADQEVDFWIELGGDKTLTNIVKNISEKPLSAMNMDGDNLTGFLGTVALTWVMGNEVDLAFLFDSLFAREFNLNWEPSFFTNPCEALSSTTPELTKSINEPVDETSAEGSLMAEFKLLISKKLEFPVSDIDINFRFLDDLHLNSLEVGQLITEFASSNQISIKAAVTEYANASIKEVVEVLSASAASVEQQHEVIQGIEPWVHYFGVSEIGQPLPEKYFSDESTQHSNWEWIGKETIAVPYSPDELNDLQGQGLLFDLRDCSEKELIQLLSAGLQKLKSKPGCTDVIVLQSENVAGGFTKSIFLESPDLKILLITAKETIGINILKAEQRLNTGFNEVVYRDRQRLLPVFQPLLNLERGKAVDLSADDVILITGGAKGITAECALALGKQYQTKLLLLGRSDPKADQNLVNNLKRFDQAKIDYRYYQIDLTRKAEVDELLKSVLKDFGKITGFIHGAGMNRPISWRKIGVAEIEQTHGAKLLGLRNILSAFDPSDLKMLITFGSIIAESGMTGNADYALVNEWLRNETATFSALNPGCKSLNVEWSVWSGAGMGEHLGVLEQLMRSGIQPVSLDKGTGLFLDWMSSFPSAKNIVVSGRYGNKATLKEPEIEIPLLRYVEDVKLCYPGLEIIAEFELSEHHDLYLKDHQISGEFIFPAVMGLEAMQQVASVLLPERHTLSFQQTRFAQPIVVSKGTTQKVRVIASRSSADKIKVVLRCESTHFSQDHFEAVLSLNAYETVTQRPIADNLYAPKLNVETDLYDSLLFHQGIFRVINHYDHLSPYHCIASGKWKKNVKYFSTFNSSALLSFEPTLRDAALHCVQACVPDFRLLPVGFQRIHTYPVGLGDSSAFSVEAVEIKKEGKTYHYDLFIRNENDELIEYWEEVKFKVLSEHKALTLPADLVGVIVQRRLDELQGARTTFAMVTSEMEQFSVFKRYDGKPYVEKGHISKTHLQDLTIQVLAPYPLGCDLEQVIFKDDDQWLALLGPERFNLAIYVSRYCKEDLSIAATRIWGIAESIKKADLHIMETILFESQENSSLHYYKCGSNTIISLSFWSTETNTAAVFTLAMVDEYNPINNEKV